MPYNRKSELPDALRNNLPDHAQEIYMEAYNNAWKAYAKQNDGHGGDTREEVAHMVAWSAVKKEFVRKTYKWVRKKE